MGGKGSMLRLGVFVGALGCGCVAGLALAAPASAAAPTALVEDLTGELPGIQMMDSLEPGRIIKLAPTQTLTLSYLESCKLETITGGTVTIGTAESKVEDGTIDRKTMPCDGGKLLLTAEQSGSAGVSVTRGGIVVKVPGAPLPKPDFTMYKTAAMVVVPRPGKVVFDRLDSDEPPIVIDVPDRTFDFAKGTTRLAPGGLYRVKVAGASYVVKVDPAARDEGGPAIGRLVRF